MANFGWAYVDCDDAGSAAGPAHSLQFVTGSGTNTTGSYNLLFYSASHAEVGHPGHVAHLILSGNLTVTGAISASAIHYQDISHIDATGSTFFGDSFDDLHVRTGSLSVWGAADGKTAILSSSARSQQTFVRGFGGNYYDVDNVAYTATTSDYILGVTSAGAVTITIPSASHFSAGAVLVVKDQLPTRGTAVITLTCSAGAGYTFDAGTTYTLAGTMTAVSLYSDGTNWWIF